MRSGAPPGGGSPNIKHLGSAYDYGEIHTATKWWRSTDSHWRAWPKLNLHNKVLVIDGAYTPPTRVFIPLEQTRSTSSMLSRAGAHSPDRGRQFRDRDWLPLT